jgi:osmotically-inducible protein OsmY
MRKYGKWVLTLSLLAATPGITFAADEQPKSKEAGGKPAAKANNQKTAEQVAQALRSAKLAGYDIEIEVKNGVATLKGKVTDPRQKDRATAAAEKVAGVKSVNNQIELVPQNKRLASPAGGRVIPAGHEQGAADKSKVQQVNYDAAAAQQNNQQMAEQVAQALTSANLDAYDIEIRYQDGVVSLDGTVETAEQRMAATQVCQRIPGVSQVANRLQATRVAQGPMGPGQPYGGPQGINPAAYQPPGGPMAGPQGGPMMGPGGQMMMAQGGPMAPGGMGPGGAMMAPPGAPMPASYGQPGGMGPQGMYNQPGMPDYAWPSYAQYPNYAAVQYPSQYSASAWPYIGPFYPYPQVPLGWRKAQLEWDDGQWNLKFNAKTDRWFWFLNPSNW